MPLSDYLHSTPFRIAAKYAALFAASVVVLFAVVYWLVTDESKIALRAVIEQDTRALVEIYRAQGTKGLAEAVRSRVTEARDGDAIYALEDKNGVLLAGNAGLAGPVVGWRQVQLESASHKHTDGDEKENFLVHVVPVGDTVLLVGRSLFGLKEVQEVLLRALAWALGLTVVMALAGGIGLGHSALRRIEVINRATREIIEGNLSRRVPTGGTRDELDRLAGNINLMLDRIEQLMANLQQVTNDIAHDLRTPLGRLRQVLETARLKDSRVEEYQAAIDRAIEQADTILDTFAALLRIAQIESRARRGRFASVDLSEIANRILEAYETVAEDAGQTLAGDIAAGVYVRGDKDLLTQMLANLVENTTTHCPAGTTVTVSLSAGAAPTLTVADTGPGIPVEAREAVLRRFYRLEKSRTTPGSGLGLALVKAIADLHNAALTLSDNQPGLCAGIQFPAAPDR